MSVKIYETTDNILNNVSHTYEATGQRNVVVANNAIRLNMNGVQHNSSITGLNIGSNITIIDCESFKGCRSLGNITGGSGLATIEDGAFANCTSLATADILGQKNSINMIGTSAFYNCGFENLTINISEQTGSIEKSIEDYAFAKCNKLKTLEIQCDQVYNYMFSNCTSLDSLKFCDKLKIISERAFENCTSLTSVNIEGKLNTIGSGAFYGCQKIKEFSFGQDSQLDGISCIGNDFLNGTAISTLTFPASLTSLGSISDNALSNLTDLQTIRFNGITSADLFPSESMEVEYDIEPNIWLVAKKDIAVGKLKYQKVLSYNALYYAVDYAISNHIPIIMFYGCEGCGYSTGLESHINSGSFMSWMKGLSDNQKYYMFISVYGPGKVYSYISKRLYKGPTLFNYTFPDCKQILRCGKVNVMYIGKEDEPDLKTYKWSLLSFSRGDVKISIQSQPSPPPIPTDIHPSTSMIDYDSTLVPDRFKNGNFYVKQPILDVLKNNMLGSDLRSVTTNNFGKQIVKVGNRIKETNCFGLNHAVTLYSSEGVSAIYDPSKQSV